MPGVQSRRRNLWQAVVMPKVILGKEGKKSTRNPAANDSTAMVLKITKCARDHQRAKSGGGGLK